MHRLVILMDAGRDGTDRLEVIRPEPTVVAAVIGAVRDAEAAGRVVAGILDDRDQTLVAADLIIRLRRVARGLSEEDLAELLDLLPL